jgi:hypothetical protein
MAPQVSGDLDRLDPSNPPPPGFVSGAMQGAVVTPAQRDGKFVADLAAQGAGLSEAEMVRVGRFAAADNAGLSHDEPQVRLIAVASRFAEGERALVDPRHRRRGRVCWLADGGGRPRGQLGIALIWLVNRGDACRKRRLTGLGVLGGQGVLRR